MESKLYSDDHPNISLKGTGFKNATIANNTIKLIKNRSLKYQFDVINTMYNRAKYHPNQTIEMKDAMKIFKIWLLDYKNKKAKEPKYKFLPLETVIKYEILAKEYGINSSFIDVYKKIKSSYKLQYIPYKNGQDYYSFRNALIKSKLEKLSDSNLFYTKGKYKGLPTKKHLLLIMHAYSPVILH